MVLLSTKGEIMKTNKILCAFAIVATLVINATAQMSSVYLVQITDMAKNSTYEVMSRDQLSELKKQISEETRAFPAAMAAVQKEWKESELTAKTYFPGSKLSPRKVREQGPMSADMANKKKERLNDRMLDSQMKDAKKRRGRGKNDVAFNKQMKEAERNQAVETIHDQLCTKLKEALGRDIPKNSFGGDFL
jgi:hypothetical protein